MPPRSKAAGKAASKTAAAPDSAGNGSGAATANGAAGNSHGTRLVIVESPAKARTIAGYLGSGYVVESSIGHIRDMPDKAAEIPEKYRAQPWARLGVDVDHDFTALYVVPADKKQQVSKLKSLLKDADELYLATDEDREGEAIAWHLLEELKPKVPTRRMVFHEITPEAIARAIANPTQLNDGKVDAYQTRRVLDRLYGYEVSPVLWKKVMPRLSAGRVQSVATRLVVDKEHERIAFRSAGYWDLEAEFATADHKKEKLPDTPTSFTATLQTVDGRRVAQGRDFSSVGEIKSTDAAPVLHLDGEAAAALASRLQNADFAVSSVERRPYRRSPYAPFRTTTLQQEASRKLGFSTKYTMSVAQRLYENGYITYMRTDSITLSQTAIDAARQQARELYGAEYVPDAPRTYASKVKNAQEAHEAIRPAGDRFRTPAEAQRSGLRGDELRVYDLVWKRTVSCQMKDATGESVSVKVSGTSASSERAEFGASGKIINFYGFLKAYVESNDEASQDRDDQERRLPVLVENDPLSALRLDAAEHSTRPPARYTEASLIKELEDREIGRPSTYASIIGTILDRGYVFKKGTALVPSFLAFAVVNLLVQHFGQLVDYAFTAEMEDALDEISRGEAERVPWLRRFYFGADGNGADGADANGSNGAASNGHTAAEGDGSPGTDGPVRSSGRSGLGLKALVSDITDIDAREISSFPLAGTDIIVRVGRYGPYLERDGQRANVPEDLAPDELTPEKAEELLSIPNGDVPLGSDPISGHEVVAKAGRFGPYVTEVLPEGAKDKPRTASLLKSMTLDTVTLDDALRLLSLPRTLGEIDGEPVTVQNGRYGPYVKHGAESRSLAAEEEMFTVTFGAAKELLATPKPKGRGRAAAAPPLRELGADPATGKPMVVKDGRFGPYVTDGETNASLRKGDDVSALTDGRAAELLADRRAAAPAPRARRTTTAKAPAKTTAKAPAKKTTPATAKKPAAVRKTGTTRKSKET